MSNQLAISSAFSVLMMASYVLFGSDAARVPLGPPAGAAQVASAATELLPQVGAVLLRQR